MEQVRMTAGDRSGRNSKGGIERGVRWGKGLPRSTGRSTVPINSLTKISKLQMVGCQPPLKLSLGLEGDDGKGGGEVTGWQCWRWQCWQCYWWWR